MLGKIIRSRIFRPDHIPTVSGDHGGRHFETLDIESADGIHLRGLFHRANNATHTLLYLHGNGGCAMNRAPLISTLTRRDCHIIVADYRGYGSSDGTPSEKGLVLDAQSYYGFAQSLNLPITIFGHSMGGAISILAYSGQELTDTRLVTLGAFSTIRYFVPKFLRWTSYPKIDAVLAADKIQVPWTILHEKNDEVVPFGHSQILAKSAKNLKDVRYVPLEGGDHSLDTQKIERYFFG